MTRLRITNDQGNPFTNGRVEINGLPAVLLDLRIEVEEIELPPGPSHTPDPKWVFIDANDHFHAMSTDKDHPYPTLIRQSKGDGFIDGEETFVHWYECRICAEHIEPDVIVSDAGMWRRVEPGPMSWYADVAVSPFEFDGFGGADLVSFRAKIHAKSEAFGIATVHARSGGNVLHLWGNGSIGRRDIV